MNTPGSRDLGTASTSTIPNPPNLAGRVIISGKDTWEFEVDSPSPLKANTTPSEAAYRTECLNELVSGLTIFDDRLSLLITDGIRTLRPSDLEGMSSAALCQDYQRRDQIDQHLDLWAAYQNAFSKIADMVEEDKESDQARFLVACLRVNFRVYALMATRFALKGCEERLRAAGRENEAVDTQVELRVWDQQLSRKVSKFSSDHLWLTLGLKNVFSRNEQLKHSHPACPPPAPAATPVVCSTNTPGHEATRAQRALGMFESLIGARRGYNPQAITVATTTIPTHLTGMHTDKNVGSGSICSDVECPICTSDLYVSPPADLFRQEQRPRPSTAPAGSFSDEEDPPVYPRVRRENRRPGWSAKPVVPVPRNVWATVLASQLGGLAQSIANKISPFLTTPKKPVAPRKVCVVGGREFWIAPGPREVVPPKPFFCTTCRKGFHIECIWEWFTTSNLPNRKCPYCRSSMDRYYVEYIVRPMMLGERRRKRRERRRLARARR
jgi:hypothetical protein